MKRMSVLLLFLLPMTVLSQVRISDSDSPFNYFLGSWRGQRETCSDEYSRTYTLVLKNKFIEVREQIKHWPSQVEENQIQFIKYDFFEKKYILYELNEDSHLITYTIEGNTAENLFIFRNDYIDEDNLVWKTRLTLEILSPDEYMEKFEYAEPGQDFSSYNAYRIYFKRVLQ